MFVKDDDDEFSGCFDWSSMVAAIVGIMPDIGMATGMVVSPLSLATSDRVFGADVKLMTLLFKENIWFVFGAAVVVTGAVAVALLWVLIITVGFEMD